MFYLDHLYSNNQKYPMDGTLIEKFVYYRQSKDDIDVDVCKENMKIFKSINPCISSSASIVSQKLYNQSGMKYEIHDGEKVFRGETLVNCMQILLQIVNYDSKYTTIYSSDFDDITYGLKHSSILSKNKRINELLHLFIKECYSEGNFFAIPFIKNISLNQAKGRLKQKGYDYCFVDSADTYFLVCYEYFANNIIGCSMIKYIDVSYKEWKDRYQGNWKLFIDDNMFQDFVDANYNPVKMWTMESNDFEKDLEQYLIRTTDFLSKRRKRINDHLKKSSE